MQKNKFTVIIPTYNRGKVLKKAIHSVINQSYQEFELLIVDNASTDNTSDVIKSIKDDRISFYVNDSNKGLWRNHNIAINHASAEWILILHSDEELRPNALEDYNSFISNLDSKTIRNIGFISGISKRSPINNFEEKTLLRNNNLFYSILIVLNGISQPSGILFKKSSVLEAGGFNEDIKYYFAADHSLYLKLILNGKKCFFIKNETVFWHDHVDRASNTTKSKQKSISIRYFVNILNESPEKKDFINEFSRNFKHLPSSVKFRVSLRLFSLKKTARNNILWLNVTSREISLHQKMILIKHYLIARIIQK